MDDEPNPAAFELTDVAETVLNTIEVIEEEIRDIVDDVVENACDQLGLPNPTWTNIVIPEPIPEQENQNRQQKVQEFLGDGAIIDHGEDDSVLAGKLSESGQFKVSMVSQINIWSFANAKFAFFQASGRIIKQTADRVYFRFFFKNCDKEEYVSCSRQDLHCPSQDEHLHRNVRDWTLMRTIGLPIECLQVFFNALRLRAQTDVCDGIMISWVATEAVLVPVEDHRNAGLETIPEEAENFDDETSTATDSVTTVISTAISSCELKLDVVCPHCKSDFKLDLNSSASTKTKTTAQ